MKRMVWNPDTQRHETVVLAEDRGAWLTAIQILTIGALMTAGLAFLFYG